MLLEGGDVGDLCGLVFPGQTAGGTPTPAVVDDIDVLPYPARHLFDLSEYEFVTISATRGCPFNCVYCSLSETRFRCRSAESVVEEVRCVVKEFGVRSLDFIDDVFTFDRCFVEEFCGLLEDLGLGVSWACTTRADLVDEKLLKVMKDAGLRHISFGVESGVEEIRKAAGKDISNRRYLDLFGECRKLGIKTRAYGMFGLPGETLADMDETICFIRGLRPDSAIFRVVDLVPNTPLFDLALSEGLVGVGVWREYVLGSRKYPIHIPKVLTEKQIYETHNRAYHSFYGHHRFNKILSKIPHLLTR